MCGYTQNSYLEGVGHPATRIVNGFKRRSASGSREELCIYYLISKNGTHKSTKFILKTTRVDDSKSRVDVLDISKSEIL